MIRLKLGKVEKVIYEKFEKREGMVFALIDPCDYESVEAAVKCAREAEEGGADVILIGGSTNAQGDLLDGVARGIKEKAKVPVVLFPGNIATLTKHADAVYFMSLLNSRNTYWMGKAQLLGAPIVKQLKIEAIPVGYIVVEPGGTVGWIGEVDLVPRSKPQIAAALALAAEYGGRRIVVTDAGSASSGPIPVEMVKAVRSQLSIPYIVGGGINTPEQAREIFAAGADAVQIGTVLEKSKNVKKLVRELKKAAKEGMERRK
ncbi:MAG: geranylgeranylglyceryl/heptaprenylglyceryl phosphate synthase [Candidatus Micrarchaeota archaeon]